MATLELPRADSESGRRSSAGIGGATTETEGPGCSADIESGGNYIINNKVNNNNNISEKLERECRICHLSLFGSSPPGSSSPAIAIELGCSCKDDLAAAHKHCADTWFKIKGNKTCEICNSIAENVDDEAGENGDVGSGAASGPSISWTARMCLNGHRVLNFILACMVFAFVISWMFHFLFHFNGPSS